MRHLTRTICALCFAVSFCWPMASFAKAKQTSLQITAKILDNSGGKWSNDAIFAFRFVETYSLNLRYGELCIGPSKGASTKPVCKGAIVMPDASASATWAQASLRPLGVDSAKTLLQSIKNGRLALYFRVGTTQFRTLSVWMEPSNTRVFGLIGKGIQKRHARALHEPGIARLVYYQLSHMYQQKKRQPAAFDYIKLPSTPGATTRQTTTSKPAKEAKKKKRYQQWQHHLQQWHKYAPYLAITDICADRYTPKQANAQIAKLSATQKNDMLRKSRRLLTATAIAFKALGDTKVALLLSAATDGIRICQWSAFFAAGFVKFHSTNAKRAFWKEDLISKQVFSLGLLTAFSYRFARHLIEDIGKLVQAAQTAGHYGMVVAAWLLGKKYTGLTNMFCRWKRAKTLCKVVGTVVGIGKGTYHVLKSGYQMSAKGVVLTVYYSKKLYRGIKSVYYYFKGRARKGKAYCNKLKRAGTFFRAMGTQLNPRGWSPKHCHSFWQQNP